MNFLINNYIYISYYKMNFLSQIIRENILEGQHMKIGNKNIK